MRSAVQGQDQNKTQAEEFGEYIASRAYLRANGIEASIEVTCLRKKSEGRHIHAVWRKVFDGRRTIRQLIRYFAATDGDHKLPRPDEELTPPFFMLDDLEAIVAHLNKTALRAGYLFLMGGMLTEQTVESILRRVLKESGLSVPLLSLSPQDIRTVSREYYEPDAEVRWMEVTLDQLDKHHKLYALLKATRIGSNWEIMVKSFGVWDKELGIAVV